MLIVDNHLVIDQVVAFYSIFSACVCCAIIGAIIARIIYNMNPPEPERIFSGKEMVQFNFNGGSWGKCFIRLTDSVRNQLYVKGKKVTAIERQLNFTLRNKISRTRNINVTEIQEIIPVENVEIEFYINELLEYKQKEEPKPQKSTYKVNHFLNGPDKEPEISIAER